MTNFAVPEWSTPIPGGHSLEVLAILEPWPPTRPNRLFRVVIRTQDGANHSMGDLTESLLMLPMASPLELDRFGLSANQLEKPLAELKRWVMVRTVMGS
jgi:hypothetical protein